MERIADLPGRLAAGLLLPLLLLATTHTAFAATFTVNATDDTPDASPGNGVAQDASGDTSLRAAIDEANALAGADTIILQPNETYELSTAGSFYYGPSAFEIRSEITIEGSGARITVNPNIMETMRFAYIAPGTSQTPHGASGHPPLGTLTLRDIEITGFHAVGGTGGDGFQSGGGGAGMGGAIYNQGILQMSRVSLRSNEATGGDGGTSVGASGRGGGGGGGIGGDGGNTGEAGGGGGSFAGDGGHSQYGGGGGAGAFGSGGPGRVAGGGGGGGGYRGSGGFGEPGGGGGGGRSGDGANGLFGGGGGGGITGRGGDGDADPGQPTGGGGGGGLTGAGGAGSGNGGDGGTSQNSGTAGGDGQAGGTDGGGGGGGRMLDTSSSQSRGGHGGDGGINAGGGGGGPSRTRVNGTGVTGGDGGDGGNYGGGGGGGLGQHSTSNGEATGGNGGNGGLFGGGGGGGEGSAEIGATAGNGGDGGFGAGGGGGGQSADTFNGAMNYSYGGNGGIGGVGGGGGGGGGSSRGYSSRFGGDAGAGGWGAGGGGGGRGHFSTLYSGDGGAGGFGGGGGGGSPAGTSLFAGGRGSGDIRGGGGGGAGLGGAIFNDGGTVTMTNCVLIGNIARGGQYGELTATPAESGLGHGGGIFNYDGAVTLTHVSILENEALNGMGRTGSSGGAIYNYADTGIPTVEINNSVIYRNIADVATDVFNSTRNGNPPTAIRTSTSAGNNAIGELRNADTTIATSSLMATGYMADDFGNLRIFLPNTTSDLLDRGDPNITLPSTDLRGVPRVSTGPGGSSAIPDLGATEFLVNTPPVITVPNAGDLSARLGLMFEAGTPSELSIADAEASGSTTFTVTIMVASGTLTLSQTTSLSVIGNGNSSLTITGPLDAINAALDGAAFAFIAPAAGAVIITANDLGTRGDDGPKSTQATASIGYVPNAAPVITVPGEVSLTVGDTYTFEPGTDTEFAVTDDAEGDLTIEITYSHGALTLASDVGLTVTDPAEPAGDTDPRTLTIVGSAAAINDALNGATFEATTDGSDLTIDVTATDAGSVPGPTVMSSTAMISLSIDNGSGCAYQINGSAYLAPLALLLLLLVALAIIRRRLADVMA